MEVGPFKEEDGSGTDRAGKLTNDAPEIPFSVENIKNSLDPNGKEESIHLED